MTLARAAEGQFSYITNNGAITITSSDPASDPPEVINIPDTIDGMSVTAIRDYAFAQNEALTYLTIANSVTNIGAFAFFYCTSLPRVTIPDSVISMGTQAFQDCASLTNAVIGKGLTNLTRSIFISCTNLAAIDVDPSNPYLSSFDGAVYDRNQSTLITCPQGKSGSYTIAQRTKTLSLGAFYRCINLMQIALPNGLNTIELGTFYQCYSLESIVIPNSVRTMGHSAFFQCRSLSTAIFGNGITDIGKECFQDCTALTELELPKNLNHFGEIAFLRCSGLTSVVIPKSVTSFDFAAFGLCTNLNSVYFLGNAPAAPGVCVFCYDTNAVAYYLPNTKGWSATYSDMPTAQWSRKDAAHH